MKGGILAQIHRESTYLAQAERGIRMRWASVNTNFREMQNGTTRACTELVEA